MTLSEIWKLIISNPSSIPIAIFVLLSLIEVSKIKINPWSWIGGIIGKLLGVKAVSDKVDALEKKVDENQATTIRVRILNFENELQEGRNHSKDSWDQVMDDIQRYEQYTNAHPEFKNNITVASTAHIMHTYGEMLEKHAWTTNLTSADRRN
jgi:hypothetical protein